MIKIIDTYSLILKHFDNDFTLEKWKNYVDGFKPSLKQLCIDDIIDYDFDLDVLPVINNCLKNKNEMKICHDNFLEICSSLNDIDVDAEIILYLGLCNGAGWVTKVDGIDSVLIGIEKVLELNWQDLLSTRGLLLHELGHLYHFQKRTNKSFEDDNQALWQLYSEGMAMYFEQRYLNDENYYHQKYDDWLNYCQTNQSRLFKEFFNRIETNKSVQDFFGDWVSFEGFSDIGYYLGSILIKDLSKKSNNQQLLDLDLKQIYEALKSYTL